MIDLTGYGLADEQEKSMRQLANNLAKDTGRNADSILQLMASMIVPSHPSTCLVFDAIEDMLNKGDPGIIDDLREAVYTKFPRHKLRWRSRG